MRRTLFKSKIHRATLTGAHLDYEGSISGDRDLMEAALGDTPTAAQTAVYQRQVVKAEEQQRFLATCGEGYESSYLGG